MTVYSALIVAVVFASGTFLLLQRDLTRVVVGIILVSNSAVLFIISAGLSRGVAPILPLEGEGASDPLVQARSRALQARGRDPFNDYFVAEAAVSLKQGAGRLIRHEEDRGLLVIGDVRVRQMGYGKRLLRALPPMTALTDESEALAWLDELTADH